MRAAVSKIKVPAAGARLASVLRGVGEEPSPLAAVGMRGWWRQKMDFGVAGGLGFTGGPDYFYGDFLAGAMGALQHLADGVVPTERSRRSAASSGAAAASDAGDSDSVVDVALRRHFQEAMLALDGEGLQLRWELEEVSMASFGGMSWVFGARRHPLTPPRDQMVRSLLGSHVLVAPAAESLGGPSPLTYLHASTRRGATLSVDAVLTARQTVVLKCKDSGEVVAATFDEAARHHLRLEADVAPQGVGREGEAEDRSPAELWQQRPLFDEERGWLVSDLNACLAGNCVASSLPGADAAGT